MAIAIGSLVDDAIVDVENVYKRLRQNRRLPEGERLPLKTVVFEASKEVRLPILNSTFIIVVSFLPLFFLSGMEGRMLAPLGIAFIVALFASTVIALTLTPVLCSYLLKNDKNGGNSKEPLVSRYMLTFYKTALAWSLDHKKIILIPTAVMLVIAIGTAFTLGRSFLPPFNEGSFTINVSTVPGISLEESDNIGRLAEEILLTVPEITTVARKTGRAELDEHALGVNTSEIEAPFSLSGRSKDELLKEIREKLSVIPGVNIEIGQPISHRIDAMLSGTRANIAIKIFGTDLNKMYSIGNKIKGAISEVDDIVDINVEQQIERPQLKIIPRREIMAKYGITPGKLAEYINVLLAGETVSQVYEGNRKFDITVKLGETSRNSIENIRNMMIDSSAGKIPLSDVADVVSTTGPNTINRENAERKIVVSANISGGDLHSGVNEIKRRIDEQIELPEGYHIEYGGQFENEEAASKRLSLMSVFSVFIIFLLLFSQFRSAIQSGVILLNLPLALIGGILTLKFTDGIISIPAIIGFISLFGIATRNGMLLIDRYNRMHNSGKSIKDTIIDGSADRLTPIIMTALTSALALIPLAIGGDLPGNEIQSPMAKVILGGLLTSTLLNIFIIPIAYMLTENYKKRGEAK
ncbi:MAG: efflux RND transporter permease subunit, partial [Bacteroidales bacterium]